MKFALWIPLFLVLPLSSCTQRTVLESKQSYSISGNQWGGQVGDEDKLREKFAGGFEITKDGQAIATGNKKNPFEGKEFEIKEFDSGTAAKEFSTGSQDDKKMFSGLRDFKEKAFNTGKPASESSLTSSYATRESGMQGQGFETNEWNRATERYRTSKAADSDKVFFGPKNANEQNSRSVNAKVTASSTDLMNNGNLTVDDVRKLLHPDQYE